MDEGWLGVWERNKSSEKKRLLSPKYCNMRERGYSVQEERERGCWLDQRKYKEEVEGEVEGAISHSRVKSEDERKQKRDKKVKL